MHVQFFLDVLKKVERECMKLFDIMWLHKINCHFAQLLFSGKQSAALN